MQTAGSPRTMSFWPSRAANRLAIEDAADQVAERHDLRTDARRHDRIAPGPLDMADHRQRSPLGMREEPLRQGGNERTLGHGERSLAAIAQARAGSGGGRRVRPLVFGTPWDQGRVLPTIIMDLRVGQPRTTIACDTRWHLADESDKFRQQRTSLRNAA